MKVYAMKDLKSERFGPLMQAESDGHMCRLLHESLSKTQATAVKYPEDFALYCVIDDYDDRDASGTMGLRFVCALSMVFPPDMVAEARNA